MTRLHVFAVGVSIVLLTLVLVGMWSSRVAGETRGPVVELEP